MSNAHQGSRLILLEQLSATNFSSFHADYNIDTSAIWSGDISQPVSSGNIYTMRPDGRFGGGVAIEEATTNLWSGLPSIYNNYASNGQMLATITTLSDTYMAQPIYRTTFTPVSANALTSIQTVYANQGVMGSGMTYQSGNIYTASIYWRAFKSDVSVSGAPSNMPGWYNNVTSKTNDGWNRTTIQWYNTVNGTDSKFWSFMSPSTQLNEAITVDWVCPQIEQKPFATSYINGSRIDGKLWYPKETLNPYVFTISCWFNIPYMHQVATNNTGISGSWYHPIIEYCPTSNRGATGISVVAGPNASGFNRLIRFKTTSEYVGSLAIQDNTWYHLALTYDGTTCKLYINGTLQISTPLSSVPIFGDTMLMVGGGYFGKSDIIMSDLYIDNGVAHNQTDILAWYTANKPFYNPYDYRAFAY